MSTGLKMGLGAVGVLKKYLETPPNNRKVELTEFQKVSKEDRLELAREAAELMGWTEKEGKFYVN